LHAKDAIFFKEDISLLFRGMGTQDWVRLERKIPIRTDQRDLNPTSTCRLNNLIKIKEKNVSWLFPFGSEKRWLDGARRQ